MTRAKKQPKRRTAPKRRLRSRKEIELSRKRSLAAKKAAATRAKNRKIQLRAERALFEKRSRAAKKAAATRKKNARAKPKKRPLQPKKDRLLPKKTKKPRVILPARALPPSGLTPAPSVGAVVSIFASKEALLDKARESNRVKMKGLFRVRFEKGHVLANDKAGVVHRFYVVENENSSTGYWSFERGFEDRFEELLTEDEDEEEDEEDEYEDFHTNRARFESVWEFRCPYVAKKGKKRGGYARCFLSEGHRPKIHKFKKRGGLWV